MRSGPSGFMILAALAMLGAGTKTGTLRTSAQETPLPRDQRPDPAARAPENQERPRSPLTETDIELLARAHQIHRVEIDAARMAIQNSQHPELLSLAEHILREHEQADRELLNLVRSRGADLRPPTLRNSEEEARVRQRQTTMARLQDLHGAAFDREYLTSTITRHEHALEVTNEARENAQDPEVRAMLQELTPMLGSHLAGAERLRNGQRARPDAGARR